jgi:hypothetical protein
MLTMTEALCEAHIDHKSISRMSVQEYALLRRWLLWRMDTKILSAHVPKPTGRKYRRLT